MASILTDALVFLESFGFFDVVLPFLLVFTLVFAILEKTKILGVNDDTAKTAKKNINAMVAFAIGLFVVLATQVIKESLPLVALVLVIIISLLLLVGSFHGKQEGPFAFEGKLKTRLVTVMVLATLFIFLSAIKTSDGISWLAVAWNFITTSVQGPIVQGLLLMGAIIGVILYVVNDKKTPTEEKGKGKEGTS